MILESKEAVIASMMKISRPAVNLSKTLEDLTSQDPARGEDEQTVAATCQDMLHIICSRLRTSGRGQLEVSRRQPGHHRRDPAPSQQQEAPLTRQVSHHQYHES